MTQTQTAKAIRAAGYIAVGPHEIAIYGIGETAQEAIERACREAADPSAREWLIAKPASAGLIFASEDGYISWEEHEGVCCLREEIEDLAASPAD